MNTILLRTVFRSIEAYLPENCAIFLKFDLKKIYKYLCN